MRKHRANVQRLLAIGLPAQSSTPLYRGTVITAPLDRIVAIMSVAAQRLTASGVDKPTGTSKLAQGPGADVRAIRVCVAHPPTARALTAFS